MAGTGKTAISLSFIRLLLHDELLGGYFLCSRNGSQDGRDVTSIFPSLSQSLADFFPSFRATRSEHIDNSRRVLTLDDQFITLLGHPIQNAFCGSASTPVLVIDALDECEDRNAVGALIDVILKHAPGLNVKFFLTSRPEQHIQTRLERTCRVLRLHDVYEVEVQSDIRVYLEQKLREIGHLHNLIPSDGTTWPPQSQLDTLSKNSGRFFIYASTAVQYISTHDPEYRLGQLTSANNDLQLAKEPVYALYSYVLGEVFSRLESSEAHDMQCCLGAITCAREALSVADVGELLGIPPRRVASLFSALRSLIHVTDSPADIVTTFHISLQEYLLDHRYSNRPWFVNGSAAHLRLAYGCLDIMSTKLHFNISGASSSFLWNSAQELATISSVLSYACRYWQDHVVASAQSEELLDFLESCVRSTLLYWIEVLSVLGLVHAGPAKLRKILVSPKVRTSCVDLCFLSNGICSL